MYAHATHPNPLSQHWVNSWSRRRSPSSTLKEFPLAVRHLRGRLMNLKLRDRALIRGREPKLEHTTCKPRRKASREASYAWCSAAMLGKYG
jgi:hypothetical protein